MTDISGWLGALGLERYADIFAENGVDMRALPFLTDQDLAEMGVLLGHRRILLAAISTLGARQAPVPAAAAPPPDESFLEGERRTLTVMFCDLVGSTELSTRLDVEDYRTLIRTYQETCAVAVARYDGYIAKYMGDGLLVYFGYPVAHDDDARRAVRAALDIVTDVQALTTLPDRHLAVRIGIATGETVVGDVLGEGEAGERSVLGMTPNLAARLQGVAGANEIIVSEATRRRLREGFALTDLGVLSLKGIAEPTQAWRIDYVAEIGPASRPELPFVGRGDILDKLDAAWSLARKGAAQVIHVTGEPGTGKSRLILEFESRLDGADVETWRCSAFQLNTPLHPLPVRPASMGETAGEVGEEQRRQLFRSVAEDLSERAAALPVLLAIEDAQWIDPTTAELLETLVPQFAECAILLVVIARRGDTADRLFDTIGGARIELAALTAAESAAIVEAVAGYAVPEDRRREIVERAGGSPLFLEELTRAVAEGGAARIPASLEESLLARLDALGPAKRVAQIASVFGDSFSRADLAALSGVDDAAVGAALERLHAGEMLVEKNGRHAFRHALIRDVAYGTLLRETRRRVHGEIADLMIGGPDQAEPEYVALHLDRADRHGEAARFWRRAAARSAGLWAHPEAAGYYEAALAHSGDVGDDAWELTTRLDFVESLRILDRYDDALAQLDRAEVLAGRVGEDRDWLRLHVLRGNILFPLGDADRCIASHTAALEVARRMDDPEAEARALSGIADAQFAGRRLVSAEQSYDACVLTAERHGLDSVILANVSLRGHMRLYLCRMEEARADCERAVEMSLARGNRRAELTARGSCLGKVLIEAGELAAADRAFADDRRLAAELGSRRYEALNLAFRARVALDTGARADAVPLAAEAVDIARESGPKFCLPIALGATARSAGDEDECRRILAEAEDIIASGCVSNNPLLF